MKLDNERPLLLGELETAVMNHLWDGGDGDVKSVYIAIGKKRGITLNTIHSTLKRLFDKNLLTRNKISHAHVYKVGVSREAFYTNLVSKVVGDLTRRGQLDALVTLFVDLTERGGSRYLARLEKLAAQRRTKLERGEK